MIHKASIAIAALGLAAALGATAQTPASPRTQRSN
jgi:hypothetical protein